MKLLRRLSAVSFALAIGFSLSGCSHIGVKPWQRGLLAKKEMQLISDPIQNAYDEHIYFSKEETNGGQSFGGGGCGCN